MSSVLYGVTDADVLPYVKHISDYQVTTLKRAVRGRVYTREDAELVLPLLT